MRPSVSAVPPGANGTTILTVLAGQVAWPSAAALKAARATANTLRRKRGAASLRIMAGLSRRDGARIFAQHNGAGDERRQHLADRPATPHPPRSSNGVGCALTITSFAPASRATSTAPAIG